MKKLKLSQILDSSGAIMNVSLREKLIEHPGELGTGREEVVRRFLEAHLPKKFGVSTGFIFDSLGDISKQLDIVIFDSTVCPRFETSGGKNIFPCEAVVAVGQVKSSLKSSSALSSAFDNLESVKALNRNASGHSVCSRSKEVLDQLSNHRHQIMTFVFVTGKSMSEKLICEEVFERIKKDSPDTWTNAIFALDQYLVTFCCDGGVCPNPMHARGVSLLSYGTNENILMHFYMMLGQVIEGTSVATFPYADYLHDMSDWKAQVFFSATDDPPPYLSQIIT